MAKAHARIELNAQKRTVLGHRVKQIRRFGFIPAVLYGKGQESIALQIPVKDFDRALRVAGESTLIYVNVDDKSYPTIIHDVARDARKDNVIHADFYKVKLDEKIRTSVPVVFVGESPAVKELLAIFVRNVNELEVEAFPQDLPHEISIDISALKAFGDQIHLRDIVLSDTVKLIGEPDEIIATVQEPKSQEEIDAELAEPTTDVSAVEEIKPEEKTEEGTEETVDGEKTPATDGEKAEKPEKTDKPAKADKKE